MYIDMTSVSDDRLDFQSICTFILVQVLRIRLDFHSVCILIMGLVSDGRS